MTDLLQSFFICALFREAERSRRVEESILMTNQSSVAALYELTAIRKSVKHATQPESLGELSRCMTFHDLKRSELEQGGSTQLS